jgi:hypothetical protein
MERLRGILGRHAIWRSSGKSNGVHYICGDEQVLKRICHAAKTGGTFAYDDVGLRVLLLATIKAEATKMREADPSSVGQARSIGTGGAIPRATGL